MCVVSKLSLGQCPCLSLLELNYKLKMKQLCVMEPELGRHTAANQSKLPRSKVSVNSVFQPVVVTYQVGTPLSQN